MSDLVDEPISHVSADIPERIYRHSLLTRITHVFNALALAILLLSGLNIFMAEPALYLGQAAHFANPTFSIGAFHAPGGHLMGVTQLGPFSVDTTGVLGVSANDHGVPIPRAFPTWLTLPSTRDLATARHWHFFFAWVLVLNGATYLLGNLRARHLQKDLWPSRKDLRAIPQSIIDHALLRHAVGAEAIPYNVLQKLAYLAVILVLVPGMVITGLAMSPGMDAAFPPLTFVLGGRQTARLIHFVFAWSLVGFFAIHMIEMVLAGPINEITSIITGWYRVPKPHAPAKGDAA